MRKALGSKTGMPTKKGTWGGSYQIDYGKYSSKVSCYTCMNCVDESKSCRKYGIFIPVLGKNTWRGCKHFSLNLDYATEENCDYVKHIKGSGFVQEQIDPKIFINDKNISSNKQKEKKKKKKKKKTKYMN